MTKTIPFSAACERNKDVILETIRPVLQHVKSVLEIGSGTGQHAVHFASALPHLVWQTSDQNEHLNGLRAKLKTAKIIVLSSMMLCLPPTPCILCLGTLCERSLKV